jgi:hypothetical protein
MDQALDVRSVREQRIQSLQSPQALRDSCRQARADLEEIRRLLTELSNRNVRI